MSIYIGMTMFGVGALLMIGGTFIIFDKSPCCSLVNYGVKHTHESDGIHIPNNILYERNKGDQ